MKVCLVIIYNHQHNNNIKIINKLYGGKFSRIVHLMPFYDGDPNDDVITIFESSYCFQGFIAQGSSKFIKEEYNYYFFLADDCILNPKITEESMCEYFGLSGKEAYIKNLESLTYKKGIIAFPKMNICISKNGISKLSAFDDNNHFMYIHRAYKKLENTREFKIQNYIPTKRRMKNKYKKHGIEIDNYAPPLLLSFSDLVICPKAEVYDFCRLCGVFAAVNLHVELAIPTALALVCKKIITEKELNRQGKYGLQNHVNTVVKKTDEIHKLFNEKLLFIHPIKLSKCRV